MAKIRPIKRFWCWIVGHKHQAAGSYSMCWRCRQIKEVNRDTKAIGIDL